MKITGTEADLLLYALDDFCRVDINGKLTKDPQIVGHTLKTAQDLRDRLFSAHEHPPRRKP